ncbi:MAG: radical SAM protein [Candidatus Nanoarchaeia archaeon]|nr:radical SAM protein [Candidatus Nanoarchaeia archaeon]MDD5740428.1 radical SAM protein [Candidatus Nanoarchaeia archaeon]
MLVAGWSLTNACNLNCAHCYNASGKRSPDELNLKECFKVVDKLKKSGVIAINFGGGECALRPDFIDLCRYIKNKGIAISYTTNGTTFDRIKDHLNLFHDIGVSIDFADAEKHDQFRGRNGTFNKAIHALEVLVKKGIDNEMVTCLTKLNCSEQELQKLYNLADKLNVDSWRLNRFRANGRGIENEKILALSKKDLKKSYTYLNQFKRKGILTPEPVFRAAFGGTYYSPGDPSGFTAFRIQPNGEVSPSVFLSESGGNIKYQSVEKIMNSDIFKRIRDRHPNEKCKSCNAYYHCKGGDAGASYLAYGHFNGPDPLCWLNPKTKKPEVKKDLEKNWNVHELYLCTLYIPVNGEKNGK